MNMAGVGGVQLREAIVKEDYLVKMPISFISSPPAMAKGLSDERSS